MIRRVMEEVEAEKAKRTKKTEVLSYLLFCLFCFRPAFIIERLIFQMYPDISLICETYDSRRGSYVQFDGSELVGDCVARTGRHTVRNRRVYMARHHIVDVGGALWRLCAGGWNLRGDRILQARRCGRALVGAAV